MQKDVFTYIIGGKAGEGTKKAGLVAAHFFSSLNRHVFQMNDYPSLIRGGHNFSVVSTSTKPIYSHYMQADLLVALDKRSYHIHKDHVKPSGVLVYNSDEVMGTGIGIPISSESKSFQNNDLIKGVAGFAILCSYLGYDKKTLDKTIENEYKYKLSDNKTYAHSIYEKTKEIVPSTFHLKKGKTKKQIYTGSDLIALGAAAGGLDLYFAYPMTPATPVLHFFASHGKNLGVRSLQAENEIAVANMAIGASVTGARTMVGTSGGGFCLMQEAFSLAGMAEVPVLFFLAQRPGPSTGVPTYTEQADLLFSLYPGQGEFPRIVASPGTIEESFYLANELLDLVWQFQTPGILLSEKHLSESGMSVSLNMNNISWAKTNKTSSKNYKRYKQTKTGISPLLFPPSDQIIKWNSYEHDSWGITTENANEITQMHLKRATKLHSLIDYLIDQINTINIFGNGGPIIFTFGSTTMSVLEALDYGSIDATVVQPIYLQPFPIWALEKYRGTNAIIIEQNSTGQFEQLLNEKLGVTSLLSIRQYDGRPFDPVDIAEKLQKVI